MLVNNNPSFGSTRIPYKDVPVAKYLEPLNKYFEVKGFELMKPQQAADKLDFSKAAAMLDKDAMIIVGKDGGPAVLIHLSADFLKKLTPMSNMLMTSNRLKLTAPLLI